MKKLGRSYKNTLTLPAKYHLPPFVRGFIKRVLNTVSLYHLWEPKKCFIVAVSGGADSLCLLDILFLLAKKYSFALHVVHVNYRLRDKDSENDERLVRKQASAYGIPCSVLRPKINTKNNLEAKLRTLRYAFFEKIRKQENYDLIAVAHNEDDQAETFLLRLLRGSGISGLASMRPKNKYIIRPLIQMSRQEIIRYLKERRIIHNEDISNQDTKFLRNRVRHELLPFLEKKFQSKIKKILATNASLLAEDYAFLNSLTAPLPSLKKSGKSICFSCAEILSFPEPLVRYQLRALFSPLLNSQPPEKNLLNEALKCLRSKKGKVQKFSFGGLKFIRKGDTVTLLISQ